jgi:hypothetical protein
MINACADFHVATCFIQRAGRARRPTTTQPHGRQDLSCPNCRGAGALIAVWHFIDTSRVTQELYEGLQAPNLLEMGATMHSMTTPFGRLRAPPTPRTVLTPRSARAGQSVPGSPTSSAYGSFYADTHSSTFHIQTRLPGWKAIPDRGPWFSGKSLWRQVG